MRGSWNRRKVSKYASGFEDKVIKDLEERGIAYEYEPRSFNYRYPVTRGCCGNCGSKAIFQIRSYTPDLRIGPGYIEIKGKLDASTRGRMEAFRKDPANAGISLKFLFMRDNWLTRKHKTKYSEWAEKHGFEWAIGTRIPDHWIQPTSPDMTTDTPTG